MRCLFIDQPLPGQPSMLILLPCLGDELYGLGGKDSLPALAQSVAS